LPDENHDMKKLFLILSVASAGFVSCKKDMKCTCTGIYANVSFEASGLDKDEQDAFQQSCDTANESASVNGESCSVE